MNILSRYIASAYLGIFSLCLGSFTAIYLVIDFLEKLGRFTRAQAEFVHIAIFFLCKIPDIVCQVTPLAALMATLLTLGVLSRNSEIIAMRGCGVSLSRITAPILVAALAISILALLVGELVVPVSYARMKYTQEVLIGKKSPTTFFRQQNIWYRQESAILQARLFNPASRTLQGITLWQTGPGMLPVQRIEAEQGTLSDRGWLLKKVVVREISGGNVAKTISRDELPVSLSLGMADLKVLEKDADNMGIFELRRYCEKLRKGGYDATRYLAQLHSRMSLPFASLVMAFLGIPFALRGGRTSGIAVGIGASLGIGFAYFIINAIVLSFGQAGYLPPMVAAWAANFIFAAVGVWLSMTVNR